jgi:hypothetical protein
MTGTNCDLFTQQIVPVIFEPPCRNNVKGSIYMQGRQSMHNLRVRRVREITVAVKKQ